MKRIIFINHIRNLKNRNGWNSGIWKQFSDCGAEEIRPLNRRRIREIRSDSDDSYSEFEWEGGNELPKIPKFISAGSINKDVSNFPRQNVFELFLNEDILEGIATKRNRFGGNDSYFGEISLNGIKV